MQSSNWLQFFSANSVLRIAFPQIIYLILWPLYWSLTLSSLDINYLFYSVLYSILESIIDNISGLLIYSTKNNFVLNMSQIEIKYNAFKLLFTSRPQRAIILGTELQQKDRKIQKK